MSINNRIKEYREKEGFKIKPFASIVGISQGTLSDIENAKSNPSAETLTLLVRNTDINPTWLLTGEGPMERVYKRPEEVSQIVADGRHLYNDEELTEIVDILQRDLPEAKAAVLKILKARKEIKAGMGSLFKFNENLNGEG